MAPNMMEKLADKAVRGNVTASGKLIEELKDYLYRTAFLYLKNEDAALDVVGDCILAGFRSIHTLKQPRYFKTWLTRILLNAANDYMGKNIPMENYDSIQAAQNQKGTPPEEKWDLYHAIDRLPERYRSVVIMKYFDDMKISEIARTLDIPEGTVKAYLSRARNELRLYLKEDYLGGLSVCK